MRANSFLRVRLAFFILCNEIRSHIRQGLRGVLQRNLQDFVNPFNRLYLKILFDIVRNFLQIAYIFFRNDNGLDSTTVRSQKFFLQTTDGKHLTPQGNFTRHCHIGTHRNLGQCRH